MVCFLHNFSHARVRPSFVRQGREILHAISAKLTNAPSEPAICATLWRMRMICRQSPIVAARPGRVEKSMFFDELNNDEWGRLSPLVADEPVRLNRRGRPRPQTRGVLNAVLWILTTGNPWSKLPGRYPSGPTCRRRFEAWLVDGTMMEMIRVLKE